MARNASVQPKTIRPRQVAWLPGARIAPSAKYPPQTSSATMIAWVIVGCLTFMVEISDARAVKRFRVQTRPLLDEPHDRIDFGIAQWRDETLGRPARDRVNLNQLEFAAGGRDFVQPIAKCFQFALARRLAVDAHKQCLNHQRANFCRGRDVVENLAKRNRSAID